MNGLYKMIYNGFIILLVLTVATTEAATQVVKLTWTPNPEEDVKFYVIYKDTVKNPRREISTVPAVETVYLDSDIEIGKTYYYCIRAVDSAFNVSTFSDEICIEAIPPSSVALSTFSVSSLNQQNYLKWEVSSNHKISGFEVQRSTNGVDFDKIAFVPARNASNDHSIYSFSDRALHLTKYYYRLKIIHPNGDVSHSKVITGTVELPAQFEISQNFPNPFNPETTISYCLPRAGNVVIVVFDIQGKTVKNLINEHQPPGYYHIKWDGTNQEGNRVSSGIYFYQIQCKDGLKTQKMMLLR